MTQVQRQEAQPPSAVLDVKMQAQPERLLNSSRCFTFELYLRLRVSGRYGENAVERGFMTSNNEFPLCPTRSRVVLLEDRSIVYLPP